MIHQAKSNPQLHDEQNFSERLASAISAPRKRRATNFPPKQQKSANHRGLSLCSFATIVVFIIDLAGNSIGFGNRFLSALMNAIVFARVFGTLVYFGYGSVSMSVTTTPSTTAPAQTQK
jgi:hypothetical protein